VWNILIMILVFMVLGALPRWSYSKNWGYYPSGGLALLLVIVIVMRSMGRL
jgi:hypothetical protein